VNSPTLNALVVIICCFTVVFLATNSHAYSNNSADAVAVLDAAVHELLVNLVPVASAET
jgi:hypothetical protein